MGGNIQSWPPGQIVFPTADQGIYLASGIQLLTGLQRMHRASSWRAAHAHIEKRQGLGGLRHRTSLGMDITFLPGAVRGEF